MSRRERIDSNGDQQKKYKNCFVKNLGPEISNDTLMEAFGKYGSITSCVIMTDDDGKSKGFGFVAFESNEDAEKVYKQKTLSNLRLLCLQKMANFECVYLYFLFLFS